MSQEQFPQFSFVESSYLSSETDLEPAKPMPRNDFAKAKRKFLAQCCFFVAQRSVAEDFRQAPPTSLEVSLTKRKHRV